MVFIIGDKITIDSKYYNGKRKFFTIVDFTTIFNPNIGELRRCAVFKPSIGGINKIDLDYIRPYRPDKIKKLLDEFDNSK